jgi:hypothetical protein
MKENVTLVLFCNNIAIWLIFCEYSGSHTNLISREKIFGDFYTIQTNEALSMYIGCRLRMFLRDMFGRGYYDGGFNNIL